jgi:hypothetical protein
VDRCCHAVFCVRVAPQPPSRTAVAAPSSSECGPRRHPLHLCAGRTAVSRLPCAGRALAALSCRLHPCAGRLRRLPLARLPSSSARPRPLHMVPAAARRELSSRPAELLRPAVLRCQRATPGVCSSVSHAAPIRSAGVCQRRTQHCSSVAPARDFGTFQQVCFRSVILQCFITLQYVGQHYCCQHCA